MYDKIKTTNWLIKLATTNYLIKFKNAQRNKKHLKRIFLLRQYEKNYGIDLKTKFV